MLCGSLDGRGIWGRMDTRIGMAESLCSPTETITTLLIIYIPGFKKIKKISLKSVSGQKSGEYLTLSCSWKFMAHVFIQYIIPRARNTTEDKTCEVLLFVELVVKEVGGKKEIKLMGWSPVDT